MNKEKEIKIDPIDPSINEEEINIEDIFEDWDGSMYGSMSWDREKQKWVRKKFS